MANFKTHISFGIAAGILGIIILAGVATAQVPGFLITVFVVATLGSVLPDIDSDSGLPFHVAFGALTIVVCALVFGHFYNIIPRNAKIIVGWTLAAGVFVWGIVGSIFRRFTIHRGMAHSLPAALLAGLGTFFAASRFYFSDADAFILAIAMVAGFLIHLILDEIWAVVNFHGKLFVPNKAFGTALKLFSDSMAVNLLVYGLIIVILYENYDRLYVLVLAFWGSLK